MELRQANFSHGLGLLLIQRMLRMEPLPRRIAEFLHRYLTIRSRSSKDRWPSSSSNSSSHRCIRCSHSNNSRSTKVACPRSLEASDSLRSSNSHKCKVLETCSRRCLIQWISTPHSFRRIHFSSSNNRTNNSNTNTSNNTHSNRSTNQSTRSNRYCSSIIRYK